MYNNLSKTIKNEKISQEKEILEKILDKLAIVCKEKKRRRVDRNQQNEDEEIITNSNQETLMVEINDKEDKKVKKQKGVGYGSDASK